MANNYEKETRTGLHNVQEKLNITEQHVDYLKEVIRSEKREDKFIGIFIIIGVLVMNFIAPLFINPATFIYTFSPKFGPVDIAMILIGGAFLWKGIKK